jgi:hypothetical protein
MKIIKLYKCSYIHRFINMHNLIDIMLKLTNFIILMNMYAFISYMKPITFIKVRNFIKIYWLSNLMNLVKVRFDEHHRAR